MTRETRANLWFLVVFLIISLPGAVILFRKKLDPSASRMDAPDAVLRQIPFMAPPPAPPGVRWMVPPRTRAWLETIAHEKTGAAMVSSVGPGPEWEPVISPDHVLQWVSVVPQKERTTVGLLIWDGSWPDEASRFDLRARINGEPKAATVEAIEAVPVPGEVRKELVGLGFTHPPVRVLWVRAAISQSWQPEPADAVLDLGCPGDPPRRTSVEWAVR